MSEEGIGGGRIRRALPLAALSARTAGEAVVVGLQSRLTDADPTEFHIRTAERYAELLGRSRGALMKAGQMLSFTPANPMVPAEFQSIYRDALARLRNEAPPMAPELARAVLERELGRRTESAFADFDWTPLAAASIGQVHAAQLHDGRAVAVKIQYPGVAAAIEADLKNNELLATFLGLIFGLAAKKLSFEMSARISEELDYRLEAANQLGFAKAYRGHPFIHVPDVIDELCTARVLTQELVQGKSWNEALAAKQELRDSWAEAIYRFIYASNYRFRLFHADPNPGNYIFHDDGSVSFLDFGCIKRFPIEHADAMHAIGRACLRNDVRGTWHASVEGGFWRSSDPVTPEEVFAYWRGPWQLWWAPQPFTVTPEHVARCMERRLSPTGPSANALRYCTASPEYTVMGRIEMGQAFLVSQLRASNYWGSMAAEYFEGAAPVTAMGKLEHDFLARNRP
ncbi:MAG TPA: AarF/ABC1/UbiB kinase family protein [Solirubrobacteraceae bacterium]|nr:AarF/ABC1/UbiB kinase family protein [Solirubrobacteraceae bacterium]